MPVGVRELATRARRFTAAKRAWREREGIRERDGRPHSFPFVPLEAGPRAGRTADQVIGYFAGPLHSSIPASAARLLWAERASD
ncbi:hypothetical protein GCM10010331_26380 [Streptomyces xanthochromogenes]|nr:hypothetical protein GCM10010331_26380 [Streptomyces xanthochromogenes]